MNWIIDGKYNLTHLCKTAGWHFATAIAALQASGFSRSEAEAFAGFAFAEFACARGGKTDGRPEDHLSDAQWDRLTLQ